MKIVLFGANGQLGKEFCKTGQVLSYTKQEVDITSEKALREVFKVHHPSFVINSAAYTNVEKAEYERERAHMVNAVAPGIIAKLCEEYNTTFIHISTDYVFDGNSKIPYRENDFVNPINIYGVSKMQGEGNILNYCTRAIIIRTSWVYSFYGNNFVKKMIALSQDKKSISLVDTQYGCPTWTRDLVEAIFHIIHFPQKTYGIFHYAGCPYTTWYRFAKKIFEQANIDIALKAVGNFPSKVLRPMYSVLDCSKIQKAYNLNCKDWSTSLKKCLAELACVD